MKKELVNNLNVEWEIDANNSYRDSSMQHLPKEVVSYIMKSSQTRYYV
jgi:hypothetical protein